MVAEQVSEFDPAYVLADLNSRVRILENKQNTLTERLLIVNQNMIQEYKRVMKELSVLSGDMIKCKGDVNHVQEVLRNLVKDMGVFAKKEDMKVVEKYIKLWDVFSFVTEEQLSERLKEYEKKRVSGRAAK